MPKALREIILGRYQMPAPHASRTNHYADDPVVRLVEIQAIQRTAAQLARLPYPAATAGPTLLDPSLEWGFREYIVQRITGAPPGASDLIGSTPPRLLSHEERAALLSAPQPGPERRMCLFNVLVAIEWHASERYLRQLMWAFRRASDFLYDVTDGSMAFGQVVFGGPELMPAADFQIMASNRYHPRSWVNGLHDGMKYQPIRGGRGLWDKNNSVCISWEEPEAFRTIVHEWGHYALALKDEYLAIDYAAPNLHDPSLLERASADEPAYRLCIPGVSLALETIMSTLATSELMAQQATGSHSRRLNEWERLRTKQEFAFLRLEENHLPLDGPMQLPLPLPTFATAGSIGASAPPEYRLAPPSSRIQLDHCWVYLLKNAGADRRLIVQGTIDARAAGDGFLLLGAEPGDQIVLIGLTADGAGAARPVVLSAAIAPEHTVERPDRRSGLVIPEASWRDVTPSVFPIIEVAPTPHAPGQAVRQQVIARTVGAAHQTWQCTLFEAGAVAGQAVGGEPLTVQSLDGYVLAESSDGSQLTISSFSQGGGPGSSPPVHANPTSAGSSEGNVMLFFHDPSQGDSFYDKIFDTYAERDELRDRYADLTIITTVNHGIASQVGQQPRSYTFTFAANTLVPRLDPTLVMFYDAGTTAQRERLRVSRLASDGRWVTIPTYHPLGQSYAAIPLNARTAPSLFAPDTATRVEHYRLHLVE